MKERKPAFVDRIDEGIIVCYTVEEKAEMYHLSAKEYPNLSPGDYLWLCFENSTLCNAQFDKEETEKRKQNDRLLFEALLEKRKKRKS